MSRRLWVLTAEQMREADRRASEELSLPVLELMERAGAGLAQALLDRFTPERGALVLVVCGKGNNGGDGMVAARYLRAAGLVPTVLLAGRASELRGPAKANWARLTRPAIARYEVNTADSFEKRRARIAEFDLLVDALLGTGAHGPLEGVIRAACDAMTLSGVPIVSADLPTGVDADTGAVTAGALHATLTVALAYPKRGHLLQPGRSLCGHLEIVDIGIPQEALGLEALEMETLSPATAGDLVPFRPEDSHKGDMGRVFIVGGAPGMLGAPALTARAALRAGAGTATVGIPQSLYDPLAPLLLEATAHLCEESEARTHAARSAAALLRELEGASVLALGPGLSRHPEALELARALVADSPAPVVLDADGLFAFVGRADELGRHRCSLVVTPHSGELARLCGISREEVDRRRLELPGECARKWNAIVLLKGSPTVIASPNGTLRLNPTGNAGMATGGSGDVLTGIVAALLGRGVIPADAAALGVFLHGLAGDLGAQETGRESLVASDIISQLPGAFLALGAR